VQRLQEEEKMTMLSQLASALESKEVYFLEIMKKECRRRAANSRNVGFTNFWQDKSDGFKDRIQVIKGEKKQ